MEVLLPTRLLQYIIAHATTTYPEECCGLLIGDGYDRRVVHNAVAVRNVAEPSRIRRFLIDPVELLRARDDAERTGLSLIGVYHSHPDAPVMPSQFDFQYAWPNFTYIVLSLQRGEPQDIGAWSLSRNRQAFELDELKIT